MADRVLDRRGFLREAAAGTAGVLAGPTLWAGPGRADTPSTTRAEVLIIGAGMAGVAAGSTLRAAGINPILLEGRGDRIGGRIWSSFAWPDAPVDLGASWLTHETINPLADLAEAWGIQTVPSDLSDFTLSEADGRVLPQAEVERLFTLFGGIYAQVKLIAERRIAQRLPDLPASDAFTQVLAQAQLSPTTLRRLGFFLNYAIKEPNAAPLSDLSLKYWDDDYVFVMLYSSVFPGGYVQLVNRLANGLDIRMGHVVSEIAYGPSGVAVTTNHGQFTAPHAIVTLPHGVLSGGSVAFSPPLPAWKQGAIRRLHTGLSNKTYLRFPAPFWDPRPNTLGRIAETPESRWSTWINFYKLEGVPILMAFNHGDYAHALEAMSETQVMDAAMQVLRKQYGRGIPDPLGVQRSRWASDPFAQGTIAHVPPGSSGDDYALMGQPVGPVRFAGDSTSRDYPTLVFAAYMTGVQEAAQVLALLGLGGPSSPGAASTPGGGGAGGRPGGTAGSLRPNQGGVHHPGGGTGGSAPAGRHGHAPGGTAHSEVGGGVGRRKKRRGQASRGPGNRRPGDSAGTSLTQARPGSPRAGSGQESPSHADNAPPKDSSGSAGARPDHESHTRADSTPSKGHDSGPGHHHPHDGAGAHPEPPGRTGSHHGKKP
jgi:monoamine oxidase